MNRAFLDYYRCPDRFAKFALRDSQTEGRPAGFFRFGENVTVYGRCFSSGAGASADHLPDALEEVQLESQPCTLPFDPDEVADNLRMEKYVARTSPSFWRRTQRELYYLVRPLLATSVRRHLQKASLKGWQEKSFPVWPVDRSLDQMFARLMALSVTNTTQKQIPFIWFWPRGYSSCAIMTHDVETSLGLSFTRELKALNASFQIPASFQLIPGARYTVTQDILRDLKGSGCEVNVHDFKHDGHLFDDPVTFEQAASKINDYAELFGAKGFRAGALYRNQSWYQSLRVSYDMSVPNVAHLDPQAGGCCTVLPYFIGDVLELPVTATQDYSLFNVLETYSHTLWAEQIRLVLEQNGLLNFIVHPDYLDKPDAVNCYRGLLGELSRLRTEAGLWIPLPREVDAWWRQRHAMRLVSDGDGWKIEGQGADRACIAYAALQGDTLTYSCT